MEPTPISIKSKLNIVFQLKAEVSSLTWKKMFKEKRATLFFLPWCLSFSWLSTHHNTWPSQRRALVGCRLRCTLLDCDKGCPRRDSWTSSPLPGWGRRRRNSQTAAGWGPGDRWASKARRDGSRKLVGCSGDIWTSNRKRRWRSARELWLSWLLKYLMTNMCCCGNLNPFPFKSFLSVSLYSSSPTLLLFLSLSLSLSPGLSPPVLSLYVFHYKLHWRRRPNHALIKLAFSWLLEIFKVQIVPPPKRSWLVLLTILQASFSCFRVEVMPHQMFEACCWRGFCEDKKRRPKSDKTSIVCTVVFKLGKLLQGL